MIDKLRAIAIFANVVENGSFRGAALKLGLAPSRVSQVVSDLEQSLQVTLLYRSTRQLSLTSEGEILFTQAQAMLAAAEQGLDAINPLAGEPIGTLNIAAPAFIAQTCYLDHIAAFSTRYPKVSLKLNFSDRPSNLIRDGYDLAFRAGWPGDGKLQFSALQKIERFMVASPDYVARQAPANHPNDLEDWDWIAFEMRLGANELSTASGERASVTGRHHVTVDSASALYEFARRGLGVTILPRDLAEQGISRGELMQLLPEWQAKSIDFYAVWPDHTKRRALSRLFVEFLIEALECTPTSSILDDEESST